jgi:hypothetical protein
MNNASLNQIVNKLLAFGHGHKYIKTVAHGQLDEMDLTSRITYPLMHIVPQDITPSGGRLQFSFDIVFADMPRLKSDKPENVLEIQSDMEQIARDLYTEIKNGGVLFGDMTEVGDDWSALPFQDEYHNYLSGVTLSINIIVASNWNACEIPADWVDGTSADIPQFGRDLTIAVYDEGVFRVNAREINFIGSGVSVSADGNRANVTVTGGGGGLTCEDLPECQTIIDIEENIDTVEESIGTLNTAVSGLSTEVSDLETAVAGKVDSVTGNIVDNTDPLNPVVDQMQADWNATEGLAEILNKPTIPDVPSTIVESVVAGDDIEVDATDPANPIVGVVPHTFVRLSGTETGFPMLGNIQWIDAVDEIPRDIINQPNSGTGGFNALRFDYSSLELEHNSGDDSTRITLGNQGITITGSKPDFLGQVYSADYSLNFILRSLIDLAVLKSRLWNGSSNPTVTNDSSQGFVAGRSLWLNTTTKVIWLCTDATLGAAVWEVYYNPNAIRTLIDTTDSATLTGVTTENRRKTILIPANTFTTGDIIRVRARARKTGTAGSGTMRLRINTDPAPATITTVPLVGTYGTAANSNLFWQFKRDGVIKSTTITEFAPAATGGSTDDGAYSVVVSNLNINWSVNQYLHLSLQNSSAADTTIISYLMVDKYTNI